jgi:hypothetical protein
MLTIEAITDTRRMPLRDLRQGSLVVARITGATDDNLVESRYGIGGQLTDGMDSVFYVVLSPFNQPGRFHKARTRNQITIMTWTLWGTRTSDGALQEITTGKLKWCRHSHQTAAGQLQADFLSCTEQMREVEREQDIRRSDRLRQQNFAALRLALDTVSVLTLARRENTLPPARKLGLMELLSDAQRASLNETLNVRATFSPGWISCGIGCCSIEPD